MSNAAKKSFLKRLALVMLTVVALLLFAHGVLGKKGYVALRRMKQQNEDLSRKIEQLKKENTETMEEIKSLKSDPKVIEKIAREELGLLRPGEIKITSANAKSEVPAETPRQ
jgi:cell division protein FtsB